MIQQTRPTIRIFLAGLATALLLGGFCAGPRAETPPLILATYADTEAQRDWAIFLAESVREFGGSMKDAPMRIYMPSELIAMNPQTAAKLEALAVEARPAETGAVPKRFVGTGKCLTAGMAEAEAEGRCTLLAWLDPDTFVLGDPSALLLPAGADLGCTPVFMQRIGSTYDRPADRLWARLYEVLGVSEESVWPVETLIDKKKVRAYLNAGLLVVRPERGLLRAWAQAFQDISADRTFIAESRGNHEISFFLYQAVLSAVVCKHLKRDEVLLYPFGINYPLNLNDEVPVEMRPELLDNLVTCRHEFISRQKGWAEKIRASDRLKTWIVSRLQSQAGATKS